MLVLEIQRKRKLTVVWGHFRRPMWGKEDKGLGPTENESYMIFLVRVTALILEVHAQRIWVRWWQTKFSQISSCQRRNINMLSCGHLLKCICFKRWPAVANGYIYPPRPLPSRTGQSSCQGGHLTKTESWIFMLKFLCYIKGSLLKLHRKRCSEPSLRRHVPI